MEIRFNYSYITQLDFDEKIKRMRHGLLLFLKDCGHLMLLGWQILYVWWFFRPIGVWDFIK